MFNKKMRYISSTLTLNVLAEKSEEIVLRDEDWDITVYRICFASGFNVWDLPSETRSLRSKQGRVIIDEVAFVDDLPELMKAAFALLMWGGSVSILSTRNGEENPFNELLKEIRSGERNYSLHRTTLDDAIADGLFKTICKRANPPVSGHGGPRSMAGRYHRGLQRRGRRGIVLHPQPLQRCLPDRDHDRSLHGGRAGADLDATSRRLCGLAAARGQDIHQGLDCGASCAAAGQPAG